MANVYVVRRPFKTGGEYFPVGKVITDPTGIKLFRSKVSEGKVLLVTERNRETLVGYFKGRLGVEIEGDLGKALTKEPAKTTPVAPAAPVMPEAVKAPVTPLIPKSEKE